LQVLDRISHCFAPGNRGQITNIKEFKDITTAL